MDRLRRDAGVIVVTRATLLETHRLILHRFGPRRGAQWLTTLVTGGSILELSKDDFDLASQRLSRFPDQPISLADAVLAVVAERMEFPVWTSDHHFDVMRVPVWH